MSNLSELVSLIQRFESASKTTPAEQAEREQGLFTEHRSLEDPIARLRAWNNAGRGGLSQIWFVEFLTPLALFAGIIIGWVTAHAVLTYDGTRPINVLIALGILLGIQSCLLIMFLISWAAAKVRGAAKQRRDRKAPFVIHGRLPLIGTLIEKSLYRPQLLGTSYQISEVRTVSIWTGISSAHLTAVGFNLGAIIALLSLVLLTDLAFAWSTTLNLTTSHLQTAIRIISSPWQQVIPSAVPSIDLIEASQYVRFGEGGYLKGESINDETAAAASKPWWRFIALSLLVYGFIPRLLVYVITTRTRNRWCRSAMIRLPDSQSLLRRWDEFNFRNAQEERSRDVPDVRSAKGNMTSIRAGSNSLTFVAYGTNEDPKSLAQRFSLSPLMTFAVGDSVINDDKHVIQSISERRPSDVVIAVKAWEPPLLEFFDFVLELREALGEDAQIQILPYQLSKKSELTTPNSTHVDVWYTRVNELGDASVSLAYYQIAEATS